MVNSWTIVNLNYGQYLSIIFHHGFDDVSFIWTMVNICSQAPTPIGMAIHPVAQETIPEQHRLLLDVYLAF